MEEKPFESAVQKKINLKATDSQADDMAVSQVDSNNQGASSLTSSDSSNSQKNSPPAKVKGRGEWRDFFVDPLLIVASLVGLGAVLFFCGTGSHQPVAPSVPPPAAVSQESKVDFHPYMVALQKQIKSNWHPPEGSSTNMVMIHFKIAKNGEVSDVGFDRLSRISEADAAALKAVIESMPSIGPLPPGSPNTVDISFTFEYNVKDKSAKP